MGVGAADEDEGKGVETGTGVETDTFAPFFTAALIGAGVVCTVLTAAGAAGVADALAGAGVGV